MIFHRTYCHVILRMAYPVVIGMMARTLMSIVDTAMVGRIGPEAIAATGLAGLVIWIIISTFLALGTAVQATVSRRFGEGNLRSCGQIVNSIFPFAFLAGSILAAAGFMVGYKIFQFFVSDQIVTAYGYSYLRIRFLECLSFLLISVFRGFFNGIGNTRIFMIGMITSNSLNVVLNYVLIYGNWGFPRLEVQGAAIASTISNYCGLGIFIIYSLLPEVRKTYGLWNFSNRNLQVIKNTCGLSWPVALRLFLGHINFAIFLKIMGMVGTLELAASNIILAITSLSWMPGYGIGIAAAALVGQQLGAGKLNEAEQYTRESVKIGIVFMGFLGILFFSIPAPFLWIFTNDAQVIALGIRALKILAVIQFVDAVGIILAEILEGGAGLVRYVMLLDISIGWVFFLPLTYWLAIERHVGIVGGWLSLAGFSLLFAILMIYKFRQGSWKYIKV